MKKVTLFAKYFILFLAFVVNSEEVWANETVLTKESDNPSNQTRIITRSSYSFNSNRSCICRGQEPCECSEYVRKCICENNTPCNCTEKSNETPSNTRGISTKSNNTIQSN